MNAKLYLRVLFCLLAIEASTALAAPIGVVQSASGEVWKYSRTERARHVKPGDALEGEASISTGPDSNAVLRFQDGQLVALGSNTTFRVKTFTFNSADPASGQILFELVKGGLRSVTGSIGESNRDGWQLVTPDGIVKVSGTDFLAVMEQGLYAHVNSGAITVINSAGTTAIDAGHSAYVASEAALPVTNPVVPDGIFGELQAVALNAPAGAPAAGAGSSGGASSAAVISKTAAAVAIGAAALAASLSGGSSATTHH